MNVVDLDDYITPMDAAAKLGINYATIMARIDRGKMLTVRVGRFHLIHKDTIEKAGDNANHQNVGGTAR